MFTRAHVIFKGKVQGVFFRANAERHAVELNLMGWIRNRSDGSVEAIFEGPKHKIIDIIEWCKKHQPHARVDNVQLNWEEYQNEFDEFEIRY